jgi:hypothetical protein
MAAIPNDRSLARPAKDEWGVYDPQQAGLAALFSRLDAKDTKTTSPASRLAVRPATASAAPIAVPERPAK